MLFFNSIIKQHSATEIIRLCRELYAKDDSGVAQEDKTNCTESGCTGRAVAFDFIKSGMIDKINFHLIEEMEKCKDEKSKLLTLYLKFNALREYREKVETDATSRNLPTFIQTLIDQDVVPYLYNVSFNFDVNIEKSVDRYTRALTNYKEEVTSIEQVIAQATKNVDEINRLKTKRATLQRFINQGQETYKYLLQQLVCIKAYVYQGHNSFNQKRPAMSNTAELLGHFADGPLFIIAREAILPSIGIIARDAGHTKCSAAAINKLTALIKAYVECGMLTHNYLESDEGEEFYEVFMDLMGFIYDTANRTKSGKAAFVAVHLAGRLLEFWKNRNISSAGYQKAQNDIEVFSDMTARMVCELYHGDQQKLLVDEICQNPKVKIERPNYYNSESEDLLRYSILFDTADSLLDGHTFRAYYGIKDNKELSQTLGENGKKILISL